MSSSWECGWAGDSRHLSVNYLFYICDDKQKYSGYCQFGSLYLQYVQNQEKFVVLVGVHYVIPWVT
jgi:hypothetical protein